VGEYSDFHVLHLDMCSKITTTTFTSLVSLVVTFSWGEDDEGLSFFLSLFPRKETFNSHGENGWPIV